MNTIKGKLLIAFTSLTLIIIFLSGSSFWYLRKGQKIQTQKDYVSAIFNKTINIFKDDLIFINDGVLNNSLNVIIKSEAFEKRNKAGSEIENDIDFLLENEESDNFLITENLNYLNNLLTSYHHLYMRIINNLEKDGNLINNNYKELLTQQDKIETEFSIINQKIIAKQKNVIRDERLIFAISAIYSILLSIFLSLFTASKISKPFKILSEIMDSSHDFKINKKTIRQLDKSTKEVKVLITSFQNLLNEISCQMEIIKEKSDILEHQNENLQNSEKQLNESNKVKDKFFSILAHDLRGPFATIQSFLEILVHHPDGFSKDEISKLAKDMSMNVEGLTVLLENLLEWSRSQKGYIEYSPTVINLKEIIDKNIQIVKIRADKKKISLSYDQVNDFYVFADYNMVDFIFRNLISNALKFTTSNGKVAIVCKEQADFMEINIIDNGIGMSFEDQQKLFRKDIQFSSMGTGFEKGTGLGLLLCKEFVERCSGTITVASIKGEGSTFKFTLPLYAEKHLQHDNAILI